MRELQIGLGGILLGFGLAALALSMRESKLDLIPHSEWQCTDVRIDGLSLPLVPVCWEYTRKDTK